MASRSSELGLSMEESPVGLPDIGERFLAPITGIAFWSAVALPFLHLPLLLATGLSSEATSTAFLVLLALNVVALLIGHPHYRD